MIGSIIPTFSASGIEDDVAALPAASRAAAEDSIGQANAVAATLPAAEGSSLADAAASAFTDALAIGFTVAAAVALLASLAVRRWLPGKPAPVEVELPEVDRRAA